MNPEGSLDTDWNHDAENSHHSNKLYCKKYIKIENSYFKL